MVHFIGRFAYGDPDGQRFTFPGSRIVARFVGTGITVTLDDGGENFFDIAVDGAPRPVLRTLAGMNSYPLATGLADGEHEVRITRRTEGFFGITQFRGFTGGALVSSPAPYARLMEVVGDSITCGYGVLGGSATCPFTADTESEPDAYAALASEMVGAAHVSVAYSGRGMYRNFGGDPTDPMPIVYERTFSDSATPAWDFVSYVPDAVVVNLGTNDFSVGDPGMPYVDAYDLFVQTVRMRYPDAWIFVATSAMLDGADHTRQASYLDTVVVRAEARGDLRISKVDFAAQRFSDGLGCDYHPSPTTHALMADVLATEIRRTLGW